MSDTPLQVSEQDAKAAAGSESLLSSVVPDGESCSQATAGGVTLATQESEIIKEEQISKGQVEVTEEPDSKEELAVEREEKADETVATDDDQVCTAVLYM